MLFLNHIFKIIVLSKISQVFQNLWDPIVYTNLLTWLQRGFYICKQIVIILILIMIVIMIMIIIIIMVIITVIIIIQIRMILIIKFIVKNKNSNNTIIYGQIMVIKMNNIFVIQ